MAFRIALNQPGLLLLKKTGSPEVIGWILSFAGVIALLAGLILLADPAVAGRAAGAFGGAAFLLSGGWLARRYHRLQPDRVEFRGGEEAAVFIGPGKTESRIPFSEIAGFSIRETPDTGPAVTMETRNGAYFELLAFGSSLTKAPAEALETLKKAVAAGSKARDSKASLPEWIRQESGDLYTWKAGKGLWEAAHGAAAVLGFLLLAGAFAFPAFYDGHGWIVGLSALGLTAVAVIARLIRSGDREYLRVGGSSIEYGRMRARGNLVLRKAGLPMGGRHWICSMDPFLGDFLSLHCLDSATLALVHENRKGGISPAKWLESLGKLTGHFRIPLSGRNWNEIRALTDFLSGKDKDTGSAG